jgi:hypothetical protein
MVSFGPVCARLPVLAAVGVLLDLFGTALLPLGRVRAVVVRVLSAGLPVLADEPASAFSLGLEDYTMHVLVVGFVAGVCH